MNRRTMGREKGKDIKRRLFKRARRGRREFQDSGECDT